MSMLTEQIRKEAQAFLKTGSGLEHLPRGVVFHPGDLPAVHFSGSSLERATAAGVFCRPLARKIAAAVFSWIVGEFGPTFIPQWGRSSVESICQMVASGMARLCFWPRLPHDLRQELLQMCRGANVSPGVAAFIVLFGECEMLLAYRGCSTIAAGAPLTADNDIIMGRNLDFDSLGLADVLHLVQVHHPADGSEIPTASLGWLGFWGILTGWNRAGLALACNVVYNGQKDDKPRLASLSRSYPMAWAYTCLLRRCPNVEAALSMLHTLKPMAPSNIMLADAEGNAVVVEWAPNRMICRPLDQGNLVATNGFRGDGMFSSPDICDRYESTIEAMGQVPSGVYTTATMRRQLHAVHQGGLTLHSAIFEPVKRRVHLATNPPPSTRGHWHEIDWDIWSRR